MAISNKKQPSRYKNQISPSYVDKDKGVLDKYREITEIGKKINHYRLIRRGLR